MYLNAKVIGLAAACTIFAAGASAQCGAVPPQVAALAQGLRGVQQPAVIWPGAASIQAESSQPQAESESDATITGFWKAVYVSAGMTVDVGFEQWHSDGTEMMNDTPPPASGNVCLGVWEKTGTRTYALVHPAFNFDAAGTSVVSIFILREQVTVSPDGNSFTGAFTWDSYDFNGHPLAGSHLAGTVGGKRIRVNAPFPFPFPL